MLYEAANAIECPIILELGTQRGESATCFLTACENRSGRLVSVDKNDCSDVSDSPLFVFVRANSADTGAVIAAAPFLADGIDLVFVDALHTPAAVEADVEAWFPYLKTGGVMLFHDVDALPYRRGQRKDRAVLERELDGILDYLYRLFAANTDLMDFSVTFGITTGLAKIARRAPGDLRPTVPSFRRPWTTRLRATLRRFASPRGRATAHRAGG